MRRVHFALSHLLPLLAFLVIVKGAYVRLSDAGLGCPDWPGCYGQLTVPEAAAEVTDKSHLAARPLETGKAWREMIHRYLATGLGFCILLLAMSAWLDRERVNVGVAISLVPLVIFQGMLGMWTVTWLLKPLVVVAHLAGGLTLLSLLWWNLLEVRSVPQGPRNPRLRRFAAFALMALTAQILLGGWTSANYAALACTDFPRCHGQWWPDVNFADAFVLWRGLGINYEYGVLDTPARTAIHLTHRLGAAVVSILVLSLVAMAWRGSDALGRRIAWCILVLLAGQVTLGISNVLFGLPLPVAVLHNGVAGLLLLGVLTLFRHARPPRWASD